jgi:hypothetical protein
MSTINIGDSLNTLANEARGALFRQAELAQLTYGAFDIAATTLQKSDQDNIKISYPVGWRPDRQAIESTCTYAKEDLLNQYRYLAFHQLAVNGLLQLVAITEALLGDILRALVRKYPHKLGNKRTITIQTVLESATIDEIHIRATDTLVNELAYKSPTEFAESLENLISVNLLECPAFHKYMEIKATRDIFIHNRGMANETYVRKAGTHQRVKSGMVLPADVQYFLESYESCLQVTEWLEIELHKRWHSSKYEAKLQPELEMSLPPPVAPAA